MVARPIESEYAERRLVNQPGDSSLSVVSGPRRQLPWEACRNRRQRWGHRSPASQRESGAERHSRGPGIDAMVITDAPTHRDAPIGTSRHRRPGPIGSRDRVRTGELPDASVIAVHVIDPVETLGYEGYDSPSMTQLRRDIAEDICESAAGLAGSATVARSTPDRDGSVVSSLRGGRRRRSRR